MLEFNSVPEKKTSFYLVRCKEPLEIQLNNVDLRKKYMLGNKTYYSYYIKDVDDKNRLFEIEKDVRDTVMTKNKDWFKNTLTETDIIDMYEPSYDDQTQFLDVLHLDKFPATVKDDTINPDCITCIKVQLLGICISKNSFSVKWVLKSIETIDIDIDNNGLYSEWDDKLDIFEKDIDKKISKLVNIKNSIRELYKNKDWDTLSKCVEEIYTC